MMLPIYIICALVGSAAISSYALFATLMRERSIGVYTSLIAALTLIVVADGMLAYCDATARTFAAIDVVHTALVVTGQGWFALSLPFCVSAVIRKRFSPGEMLFTVVLAAALCIVSLLASACGISSLAVFDDVILLFIICCALFRCTMSLGSMSEKLRPFIRIAIIVNIVAIAANIIYLVFTDVAGSTYQFGLILYYLLWNTFNVAAIFTYLSKHPENRTVLRAVLSVAAYSEREKQIIELVCEGKSNDDIADTFAISLNTVKHHLKNIFRKADVTSRTGLIAIFGHRGNSERSMSQR